MSENDGSMSSDSYNESNICSEENGDILTGCYEKEPHYTEFEFKEMKTTDLGSDSCSEEKELDSSRLENLQWCSCENCVITFSMALEECKCCRKSASLLSETLGGGIKCITNNNDYNIFCLISLHPSMIQK